MLASGFERFSFFFLDMAHRVTRGTKSGGETSAHSANDLDRDLETVQNWAIFSKSSIIMIHSRS